MRLKIDSVETGPPKGVPVILRSGMQGYRVSVVFSFSSLDELQKSIKEQCELWIISLPGSSKPVTTQDFGNTYGDL